MSKTVKNRISINNQVYKALENKETAVDEIEHADKAIEVIKKAM